ncbi:MAG: hypothetical protein GMKNLPBB_01723 [Myxococcota bacterium]|nr:hypothetical protein [Myxococcota bacterium]
MHTQEICPKCHGSWGLKEEGRGQPVVCSNCHRQVWSHRIWKPFSTKAEAESYLWAAMALAGDDCFIAGVKDHKGVALFRIFANEGRLSAWKKKMFLRRFFPWKD